MFITNINKYNYINNNYQNDHLFNFKIIGQKDSLTLTLINLDNNLHDHHNNVGNNFIQIMFVYYI